MIYAVALYWLKTIGVFRLSDRFESVGVFHLRGNLRMRESGVNFSLRRNRIPGHRDSLPGLRVRDRIFRHDLSYWLSSNRLKPSRHLGRLLAPSCSPASPLCGLA